MNVNRTSANIKSHGLPQLPGKSIHQSEAHVNLERLSKKDENQETTPHSNLESPPKAQDNVNHESSSEMLTVENEGAATATACTNLERSSTPDDDSGRNRTSGSIKYNKVCQQFNDVKGNIQQHWKESFDDFAKERLSDVRNNGLVYDDKGETKLSTEDEILNKTAAGSAGIVLEPMDEHSRKVITT